MKRGRGNLGRPRGGGSGGATSVGSPAGGVAGARAAAADPARAELGRGGRRAGGAGRRLRRLGHSPGARGPARAAGRTRGAGGLDAGTLGDRAFDRAVPRPGDRPQDRRTLAGSERSTGQHGAVSSPGGSGRPVGLGRIACGHGRGHPPRGRGDRLRRGPRPPADPSGVAVGAGRPRAGRPDRAGGARVEPDRADAAVPSPGSVPVAQAHAPVGRAGSLQGRAGRGGPAGVCRRPGRAATGRRAHPLPLRRRRDRLRAASSRAGAGTFPRPDRVRPAVVHLHGRRGRRPPRALAPSRSCRLP